MKRLGFYVTVLLLTLIWVGCHRMRSPLAPDPNLPEAFRTPEATFQTWVAASLARDAAMLTQCYWSGLSPEELQAWLGQNLDPQAPSLFQQARLLEVVPRTLVEVNFLFENSLGDEMRGVMVRTREGWKIQRW